MSSLSAEMRAMLDDSVDKFLRDHYSFDARRAQVESVSGYAPDHWQQFAELGWLGIPFSEDDGGLEEKTVVLMLDPARRELIASVRGCGENSVKRKVLSAEEWPSRTERLVPFVCVDTEHFNGFEELDEGAAVLFEACSSSSSAVADQVAAIVANAAPPLTGPS